jgi:hypothetical protein
MRMKLNVSRIGRWRTLALSLAIVGGTLLLLGNKSSVTSASVQLKPFKDPAIMEPIHSNQRRQSLGVDPMEDGSLGVAFEFQGKSFGESKLNAEAKGLGTITAGPAKFDVNFDGPLESRTTSAGHEFYYGSVDATVTINKVKAPASFVITAIPAEKKYFVTATIRTPEDGLVLLSYGEPYPEYLQILQEKFGTGGN